jgi:Mother cell inhibitor of FtsZ
MWMKVYLFEKSMTMVGKAWEIKHLLNEYRKQYITVQELLQAQKKD